MEQFSQDSDQEIHGWDDITGQVVSKVIAFHLPEIWRMGLHQKKHRAVGEMIRKNKETDPPAARVAALTYRFDHFPWQSFKISSNHGGCLSGEQLGSKVHLAGAKNGATTQESPRRDRRRSVMNGRIMVGSRCRC